MDIKLILALLAGKSISFLIKLKGGGATAAPGLYALRIDPDLVQKLSKNIKRGSVIISGTNGKTTTARLTSDILSIKYKLIHNRQGSNLLRGIASTLISHANVLGKIDADIAIWEVDEATLPQAVVNTSPKNIVLLNLFRDQLDRYGEVDTLRKKWQESLGNLPRSTTLTLNADDPGVSILAENFKGKVSFFGVEDDKVDLPDVAGVKDIKHCLNCGASLIFSTLLSAHLGHYKCPNCNFKRPIPKIFAKNLKFNKDFTTSSQFSVHPSTKLRTSSSQFTISYNLPGLYNVYNALAAASIGTEKGIDTKMIAEKIKSFSAAFGRFQKLEIEGKRVYIFLIKNPAGANEVLRTISIRESLNILGILNDNFADGKDVSWIWDTNWEIVKGKVRNISISGIRKWDLAARLKYAGIRLSKKNIYKEVLYSIKASLGQLNNKDTLIILPTYTALLSTQKALRSMQKGMTKWQNQ